MDQDSTPQVELKPSERKVIVLRAAGFTIEQIAWALRFRSDTVRSYIKTAQRAYRYAGVQLTSIEMAKRVERGEITWPKIVE